MSNLNRRVARLEGRPRRPVEPPLTDEQRQALLNDLFTTGHLIFVNGRIKPGVGLVWHEQERMTKVAVILNEALAERLANEQPQ